jgi:hypothetical protein
VACHIGLHQASTLKTLIYLVQRREEIHAPAVLPAKKCPIFFGYELHGHKIRSIHVCKEGNIHVLF